MDASGTKSSRVEAYVEAIRQQWRDWLREEEEEEEIANTEFNSVLNCTCISTLKLCHNRKYIQQYMSGR